MKGTWTTTEGGGGAGGAIGVIAAILLIAALIGPVVTAVVSLVKALVIALLTLVALALLIAAGVVVWRLRHRSPSPAAVPWRAGVPPPAATPLPAQPHLALEQPRVVNLHFYNVSPEDIAAITARHAREDIPGDFR